MRFPVPETTLAKSVFWVIVLLRLKARVPLFVRELVMAREPVVLPAPIWSVPALIVVVPV